MAVDLKYGQVTLEHGTIGKDEPVVVFRAQDNLLQKVLAYYHMLCLEGGSPDRHLDLVRESRLAVMNWQEKNKTHMPNSESSKAWLKK